MSKNQMRRQALSMPIDSYCNEDILLPNNPFSNVSGNKYIYAVGQTENERAFLTGHAMQNMAVLANMERQYAEADPASSDYYSSIMEAYIRATQETIFNYGRAGKKIKR